MAGGVGAEEGLLELVVGGGGHFLGWGGGEFVEVDAPWLTGRRGEVGAEAVYEVGVC